MLVGERSLITRTVDLGRQRESSDERQKKIVDVLVDAFSELMNAEPEAFRQKFRKMAAGPFAFYRGSACLFYADMELEWGRSDDPGRRAARLHGRSDGKHSGTYIHGAGVFIFDVNEF